MKSHALFTLTVFCRLSLSSENAFDDLKECGFAGVFFSELADGHVRPGKRETGKRKTGKREIINMKTENGGNTE